MDNYKNSQGPNPFYCDSLYKEMLVPQMKAQMKPYAAAAEYEKVPTSMSGDKRNEQAGP